MPSAARLALLVVLVVPLVSSAGCVCPGSPLFQCYHKDATVGASDSDSTQTGSATETTGATEATDSSMSMSQSETMTPDCNGNGVCDGDESRLLCPAECMKCGNGELDDGETCDDGEGNSEDNAYHTGIPETAPCNASCSGKVDFCGDGTCQMDNEDFLSCAQDGCMPVCGNGDMEEGEVCDDGNLENTDACLNNCKPASCGDGFLEAGVEECDDTNLFDDDACTSLCKPASCGDGFTWKNMEQCDDANDVETDACDMACKTVEYRKVFVSSAQYPGSLGGLTGADDKCQMLATTAGISGTFKAWLSDATTGPVDRFDVSFTGVYERVDGALVAHGWGDLVDKTLSAPINLDETGIAVVDTGVWSNTGDSGMMLKGSSCTSWTSSNGAIKGALGFSSSVDSTWTDFDPGVLCSSSNNIYCFEDPA